jgi:hypothetical protein
VLISNIKKKTNKLQMVAAAGAGATKTILNRKLKCKGKAGRCKLLKKM